MKRERSEDQVNINLRRQLNRLANPVDRAIARVTAATVEGSGLMLIATSAWANNWRSAAVYTGLTLFAKAALNATTRR